MDELDVETVEKKGCHFDIPLTRQQPFVPPGQRLAAVFPFRGKQVAYDVTKTDAYTLLYRNATLGRVPDVTLYWIDEEALRARDTA